MKATPPRIAPLALLLALALATLLIGCEPDPTTPPGGQQPAWDIGVATDTGGGGQDAGPTTGQDSGAPVQNDVGSAPDAGDPAGKTTWTVFVYGHADHNLSPSLVKDMAEMNAATFGPHIKVIVLADWDASAAKEQGVPFPSGSEWYRVLGGGQPLKPWTTVAEQNLDDPKVLTAAIQSAFGSNKADRYGLLLWDHGGAWSGGYGGDSANGTGHGQGMDAETLAGAIKAGLDGAGITGSRPLEFLSFDTCLMAGVEIAAPLQDLAKVYIANAEIDYGDGWDYKGVLNYLNANPDADALTFAKQEVAIWDAHHKAAGIDDKLIRSHVALDMTAWADFSKAFRALSDAIYDSQTFSFELFGLSTFNALPVYSSVVGDPTQTSLLRDVGLFLDGMWGLADDDAVSDAADVVRKTMDKLIIGSSQGDIRKAQRGVHMLLGLAKQTTDKVLSAYGSKAKTWDQAAEWSSTMSEIVKANDGKPPTVQTLMDVPSKPTAADPPTLTFSTADKDVAMVDISLLAAHPENPTQLFILGTMAMGAIEPGTFNFGWSGEVLGMGKNSQDFVPVSPRPWLIAGTKSGDFQAPLLGIPGLVKASDGSKLVGTLLFGSDEMSASKFAFGEGTQASVLPLKSLAAMDPKVTFVPILVVVDANTGATQTIEAGAGVVVPKDGKLPLLIDKAPAGKYVLALTTTDVWGNQSFSGEALELTGPVAD